MVTAWGSSSPGNQINTPTSSLFLLNSCYCVFNKFNLPHQSALMLIQSNLGDFTQLSGKDLILDFATTGLPFGTQGWKSIPLQWKQDQAAAGLRPRLPSKPIALQATILVFFDHWLDGVELMLLLRWWMWRNLEGTNKTITSQKVLDCAAGKFCWNFYLLLQATWPWRGAPYGSVHNSLRTCTLVEPVAVKVWVQESLNQSWI